jgi:phage terminase small subunit
MTEPPSLTEAWNLEEEMTEGQRVLRDNFVNEYLKDFDAYSAAIRCGFLATFAIDWCKRLMSEGYVKRRIAELTAPLENDTQQMELDRIRNMRHLRYIAAHGSNTERVAAIPA